MIPEGQSLGWQSKGLQQEQETEEPLRWSCKLSKPASRDTFPPAMPHLLHLSNSTIILVGFGLSLKLWLPCSETIKNACPPHFLIFKLVIISQATRVLSGLVEPVPASALSLVT